MRKKLNPATLIEDLSLYPRVQVSDQIVNNYASAMEAGAEFPPIVVEADTLRIVDGFHRRRGHVKAFGADVKISAEVVTYDSEEALFEDALTRNVGHGRQLDAQDLIRVTKLAEEHLGWDVAMTASKLVIAPGKLERLIVSRTAVGTSSIKKAKPKVKAGGTKVSEVAGPKKATVLKQIILKPALRFKAGQKLTAEQEAVNGYLAGSNATYLVKQVRLLVEADLIDTSDVSVMTELRLLADALRGVASQAVA